MLYCLSLKKENENWIKIKIKFRFEGERWKKLVLNKNPCDKKLSLEKAVEGSVVLVFSQNYSTNKNFQNN